MPNKEQFSACTYFPQENHPLGMYQYNDLFIIHESLAKKLQDYKYRRRRPTLIVIYFRSLIWHE